MVLTGICANFFFWDLILSKRLFLLFYLLWVLKKKKKKSKVLALGDLSPKVEVRPLEDYGASEIKAEISMLST